MSGHTPGPWAWEFDGGIGRWAITGPDGRPLPVGGPPNINIHRGDMPLIAAAPDLLEALRIIVTNATVIPDPAMDGHTDIFAVPLEDIDAARAAIAKAEGRS